jgi:hypothetical protein
MSQVVLLAWLACFFVSIFLCMWNLREIFYFLAGKSPVQPLALRATALANVVVAAAIKMAAMTAETRTMVMVATLLVTIALVVLAIAHFVTLHIVANAIASVVAIAIIFFSMRQRGR